MANPTLPTPGTTPGPDWATQLNDAIKRKVTFTEDTGANLDTNNPVPAATEMVRETDTGRVKVGDGSTAYNDLIDFQTSMTGLARIDQAAANRKHATANRVQAQVADAGVLTEAWADTSQWSGTGTVGGGRVYNCPNGVLRAAPTSSRWVMRSTLHSPGTAGLYAYMGVQLVDGGIFSLGQTSSSSSAFVSVSGSVTSAMVTIPRTLPTLSAGDYIVTMVKDEDCLSLTIQADGAAGQTIYGARANLADLPSAINNVFFSANDTTQGGLTWGPAVIYDELAVPPSADRTVGGVNLFGAGNTLAHLREDPNTGIGHVVALPGDLDARVPAPTVLFMHQADTGTAFTPWTDSRMAGIIDSLSSGGYILISSDNGPATAAAGTEDKMGNSTGRADYVALVEWTRQHFNTEALMLLGPSQGGFFAQSLLANRDLGGVSAVATISGGTDMIAMEQDATYQQRLWDAYGATSTADFDAKVVADRSDPMAFPGFAFRGVPQRFYVGDADTTCPPSTHTIPFQAKISAFCPESTIITVAGVGHLDASLYQASDLIAFFDTYRG